MHKIFTIIILLLVSTYVFSKDIFQQKMILMGSSFDITVLAENEIQGNKYINLAIDEIKRIEGIISSWDQGSETSAINRNAGIKPVVVSRELYNLIERSVLISKITDGAFDITYASIDKIWKFDGSMHMKPTKEEVQQSVSRVGYAQIELQKEKQSVFLKNKGMKIGFGGIGKGFAADKAKQLLINSGVEAGIINASGDMNTWGVQPNGEEWFVAITNPMNKKLAFGTLPISNKAVVTSGNYEKNVVFGGIRYAHIINPKTGYPSTGIASVTVIAISAELADALATSVFVMGVGVGLNRINQLPNIECIIIDNNGEIHKSNHISINEY